MNLYSADTLKYGSMSLNSDILTWFRTTQYLLSLLKTAYWAGKHQIPFSLYLGCPIRAQTHDHRRLLLINWLIEWMIGWLLLNVHWKGNQLYSYLYSITISLQNNVLAGVTRTAILIDILIAPDRVRNCCLANRNR